MLDERSEGDPWRASGSWAGPGRGGTSGGDREIVRRRYLNGPSIREVFLNLRIFPFSINPAARIWWRFRPHSWTLNTSAVFDRHFRCRSTCWSRAGTPSSNDAIIAMR